MVLFGVVGNKKCNRHFDARSWKSSNIVVMILLEFTWLMVQIKDVLIKSVGRFQIFVLKIGIWCGRIYRYWSHTLGNSWSSNRDKCSPTYIRNRTFVLVHNGVIENYLQIKRKHIFQNIIWKVKQITEIVVHLVGQFVSEGLSVSLKLSSQAAGRFHRPRLQAGCFRTEEVREICRRFRHAG